MALKLVVVESFTIESARDCTALTVAVTVSEVVVPSVADAVLTIEPVSMSACVTTAEPEQVSVAFGASPPAGSAGHETEAILSSATVIGLVIVTLPVFRTT